MDGGSQHCTEGSDQSHPKKKKFKKPKLLSEGALQQLRKEVKGKGEKERYIHLNAEFQRLARRDKKVFLSEQLKQKEEKKIEWE